MKKNQKICFSLFSVSCLIGLAVCLICDLVITKSFSWSLVPLVAISFAWLVLSPIMLSPRKGLYASLGVLSILIMPFIYVLSIILSNKDIFSIGAIMSIIGVVYLWSIVGICHRFRKQPYLAAGLSVLLAAPICLIINMILSKILSQPLVDMWDILSAVLLVTVAMILFAINNFKDSKVRSRSVK